MKERITFEVELEHPFKGLVKTARILRTPSARVGKEAPNLALKPTKLSPSTPLTQFLTLTYTDLESTQQQKFEIKIVKMKAYRITSHATQKEEKGCNFKFYSKCKISCHSVSSQYGH